MPTARLRSCKLFIFDLQEAMLDCVGTQLFKFLKCFLWIYPYVPREGEGVVIAVREATGARGLSATSIFTCVTT